MISYKNVELQRTDNQQKGKVKYIIDGSEVFAEEAAISYYRTLSYKALWAENTYWWTLMSLFFWDIIFAKTRGAVSVIVGGNQIALEPGDESFEQLFTQMIQMNGIPSDFFTAEFYERRKNLIMNKIQELQYSDLEQKLSESYKLNYGKNCRPIENWDKYKIDELLIAVQRLDKEKLLKILERLITDFNENRSGLPDLIVYDDKDFFFSEIKSERDKISEKQKAWHDFISTSLGLKVEIFLINHSETQIEGIKTLYMPPSSKEVTVSFGCSSSAKRAEAISFVQGQETYFTQGEGKEQIHGAKFKINESDLKNLYKILDLTSGWKTQKIIIDGEIVKSTYLRSSLWCFREKINQNASLDYCRRREYDNKPNKFGCKIVYFNEIEDERWQAYGYIDSTKGEWVFDKKKINEKLEEEMNKLKYCPLFDEKKTRLLIKKIPEKINPQIDKNYAFISNDYDEWFWHENNWLSTSGKTNFPGFNVMVGVHKLTQKEVNQAIQFSGLGNSTKITYSEPSVKTKQKSGCFIATAVYGDSEAYQVKALRYFRDSHLEKAILGRLFVDAYYKVSPPIAGFIGKHKVLTSLLRRALDAIVNIICRL